MRARALRRPSSALSESFVSKPDPGSETPMATTAGDAEGAGLLDGVRDRDAPRDGVPVVVGVGDGDVVRVAGGVERAETVAMLKVGVGERVRVGVGVGVDVGEGVGGGVLVGELEGVS